MIASRLKIACSLVVNLVISRFSYYEVVRRTWHYYNVLTLRQSYPIRRIYLTLHAPLNTLQQAVK